MGGERDRNLRGRGKRKGGGGRGAMKEAEEKKTKLCGMGKKGFVARPERRCYNTKENIIQNPRSPMWLPHNSTGYAQSAFLEGKPSLPLRALLCETIVPPQSLSQKKDIAFFFFTPMGVKP